jgi:hypothetical protein
MVSASFLYNGTRSLFEQAGFSFDRPKGKYHCVMSKTVPRGLASLGGMLARPGHQLRLVAPCQAVVPTAGPR